MMRDSLKYSMMKLDYAINTTLMTAYVSTLRGDKVGLLAFADNVHQYLSPKPGKKQFLTMLESTYALPVIPVEPDFRICVYIPFYKTTKTCTYYTFH